MNHPHFSLWAEAMLEEIQAAPSLKEAQFLLESEFIDIYNKGIALGLKQALQSAEAYIKFKTPVSKL